MKLIFVLVIVFFQMFFVNFLQIVKIVRAFRIDTLMYNEKFRALFMDQRVVAVRVAQGSYFGETILLRRKLCFTNLAHDLFIVAVVTVKIRLWGIAEGACTVIRNVAFLTSGERLDY